MFNPESFWLVVELGPLCSSSSAIPDRFAIDECLEAPETSVADSISHLRNVPGHRDMSPISVMF